MTQPDQMSACTNRLKSVLPHVTWKPRTSAFGLVYEATLNSSERIACTVFPDGKSTVSLTQSDKCGIVYSSLTLTATETSAVLKR